MNYVKVILSKTLPIGCVILAMLCCSCRQWTFKKEIKTYGRYQQEIWLPILIATDSCPIKLVNTNCSSLIGDMRATQGIDFDKGGEMVYEAYCNQKPIRVSPKFYQACDAITVVSRIDSIYREKGVKGLLDSCFRRDKGGWYLDKGFYFPEHIVKWSTSPKEKDYIAYLLSFHNIYIYTFMGGEAHIYGTKIADKISDIP